MEASKTTGSSSEFLPVVRALRISERGFCDDGALRASDCLRTFGADLAPSDRKTLQDASEWRPGEVLSFLPDLSRIKRDWLKRLTAPPMFAVEKYSKSVLNLIQKTMDSIRECGFIKEDRQSQALLDFLAELEMNPNRLLELVSSYSFAFAATCQQCEGREIAEQKGVTGKNDTAQSTELVYDYVIIDEAARALPLDLLIPMSQGRRILLVGDHRQLPQMIVEKWAEALEAKWNAVDNPDTSGQQAEQTIRAVSNLKQSMFEYLFNERIPELEKQDRIVRHITLDAQFRMHPLLGDFISRNFYGRDEQFSSPGEKAGIDYAHHLPGMPDKPLYWIDVPWSEATRMTRPEGARTSWQRDAELRVICNRLNQWMKCDAARKNELTFGVISFYRGQVEALRQRLGNKVDGKTLHVGTVDSFQGKEFDIVFLSLVRTSNLLDKEDPFGFLTIPNRLNVAMSRQKKLLVVVGDARFVRNEKAKIAIPGLHNFYLLCKEHGVVEAVR